MSRPLLHRHLALTSVLSLAIACGSSEPSEDRDGGGVAHMDGGTVDARVIERPDGAVESDLCRDCPGCCTSVGICLRGDSPEACGAGNSVCVACSDGTLCIDGSCQPPSACTGCVQGSVCRSGLDAYACGDGGALCEACQPDERCATGTCVPATSCGLQGWSCSTASPCCGGLACEAGICSGTPSCVSTGGACTSSGQCCGDASCLGGRCRECATNRASCTTDGECCSGFCRAGACDDRPDPATCSEVYYDRCTDVSDCCEDADSCMYTGGAHRCCRLEGSTCSFGGDCCGAMRCSSGRCVQLAYGERCENHTDCLTGFCVEGRCDVEDCVPEGTACGFGAGGGRGCCPGYLCYSGRCQVDTVKGRLCRNAGSSCTRNEDCCFPSACDGGICVDDFSCGFGGEACAVGSDCCSERCVGGVCELYVSCAAAGEGCGAGLGACCSGLSCIGGTCSSGGGTTCRVDGQSCDATTPCCTGLSCTSGTCETPVPECRTDGQTCSGSLPCCSGLSCNGGFCAAPPPSCASNGEACVVRPCCAGASCEASYVCGPPATCADLGAPCGASGCCAGTVCGASTTCELPRTCAAQGEGCAGTPCCSGLSCSSSSVCVPPPTCAVSGASCAVLPCCTGLACDGTSCAPPPACLPEGQLCGSMTEPLGECCADAPFCGAGTTRELNRCRRTCVPPLGSARYASDCCSGAMARASSGVALGWCN